MKEVVRVWIGNPNNKGRFNGTAFFIDGHTLVTAKHVVLNHKNIYISDTPNGGIIPIDEVKLCDRDIAILRVKKKFDITSPSFSDDITQGSSVNIIGFYDNHSSRKSFENRISGYFNKEHTYELQNHLTNGLSGSPVFGDGAICGITQAISRDRNITYIIPISELCIEINPSSKHIIEILFKNLSKINAIPQMAITSATTNRLWYINEIKAKAKSHYRDVYHIALPIDDVSDEEYFEEIADVFGIREQRANRIRRELVRLIERSRDEVFVLITDFENDKHLDDFAKLMRAVLDRVGDRLRVITIGGEKLANLKTNMGIHSYFNYFEQHFV
ncbi:hypothetical protein MNB_SV-12-1713 [hydrothermal vent metagenome]|uniref:Serine protease n=1 Tax=hydrothermal vent metagenome TaxID=652676 RepID=A0A1W1CLK1_9ZZZZ